MRKLLTSLCVVAGLSAGTTVLAGCGDDDAAPFDAARAAAATAGEGTARVTAKVSIEGGGLPIPLSVDAEGVTALDEAKGALTFDLGPLIGLAGAPQGTPGDLEVRFDGGTLWARPPAVDQLRIPGGRQWLSLELGELAAAFDLPTEGLGRLITLEPAAQLRALQAAKGMKEVGTEEIGGAETTHYRGTYRLSDVVAALPPAERKEAEQAIARLDELSAGSGGELDAPMPADIWVDEEGTTRKLTSTTTLPGQAGRPAATIRQSYLLDDFGAPLDADPPAPADTYAATDAVVDALGRLSGQAAQPTP